MFKLINAVLWKFKVFWTNSLYYDLIKSGTNIRIGPDTKINLIKNIKIGDNTYINGGEFVTGNNSRITIGKNCLISYNVHIRTITHSYEDINKLIQEQGLIEKDIIIEDDVWIGYGAQIFGGVHLYKGCVVAAGSVVTHSVPEYIVVGGVPAKQIKKRK